MGYPSYVQQYLDQQVPLEGNWPGLEPRPGQVEVDPDALDSVGNQLLGEGDGGDGITPDQLEAKVNPQSCNGWFGFWPTAGYMQHSLQTAGGSIAFYFRKVLDQVNAAATLFQATAEDYRRIDQGAAASLRDHAAGWDRLATDVDTNVEPAGEFRDSTEVPYISQYEDVSGYDADWIASEMERIKSSQSWTNISDAGTALTSTATRLRFLASSMRGLATQIDGQWSSETAAAAQRALRRIASTASDLAEKADKTATFAYESAATLQRAAQGFGDDRNMFEKGVDALNPFGDSNKDAMRREQLEVLNNEYRDVNYTTLPPYVNADLPNLPPPGGGIKTPSGPGDGTGGSGSGGYIPPTSPNMPPPPSTPPGSGMDGLTPGPDAPQVIGPGELGPDSGFDGGGIPDDDVTLPGDQEWSDGGLAGVGPGVGPIGPGNPNLPNVGPIGPTNPAAAAAAAPGGAGLPPGGNITLVPGNNPGVTPGRGAAAAGPMRPGPAAAGRPGMPGNLPGAGGRPGMTTGAMPTGGSGTGAAGGAQGTGGPRGAGGAGGPGAGGRPGMVGGARPGATGAMPMGGARRGGEGEEDNDQRTTWLMEDEDPWHGDENVPPPIIR